MKSLLFYLGAFCFFASLTPTIKKEVEVEVGPAWAYGAELLKPLTVSFIDTGETNFFEQSQIVTSWNILPVAAAKGKLIFNEKLFLQGKIEGGWLRNGRATITDSVIGDLNISSMFPTIMTANIIHVEGGGGFIIKDTLINKVILLPNAGYSFSQAKAQFDFLWNNTIFFTKIRTHGPYLGLQIIVPRDNYSLSASYRLTISNFNSRLTANTNNQVVIRTAYPFIGSSIMGIFAYRLNEAVSATIKIGYEDGHNKNMGTTCVFQGGVKKSTMQNVLSLVDKGIGIAFALSGEF